MQISRYSLIKFLELIITVVCIWLHSESIAQTFLEDFLCGAAFGGYLIILLGGASGHVMASPITRRIDVYFGIAGVALFVATGAVNIKYFEHVGGNRGKYGLAKASLAIINGVLFLLDSLITWRGDY